VVGGEYLEIKVPPVELLTKPVARKGR